MIWRTHAFSLVEVTLAIGLIAFALLAVVGLIPLGVQSSKDAGDDTRTSAIAQDAFNRTQTILNAYVATSGSLPASTQTGVSFYYDVDGRYLASSTPSSSLNYSSIATAIYVAQVNYGPPAAFSGSNATYTGANVDGTVLSAVKVSVGWPVVVTTGTASVASTNAARSVYSFYMGSTLPTTPAIP